MTCRYCGNEMRDDAKFCPHCGAVNGVEYPPQETSFYTGPEAPAAGSKKKKTGLIIGAAVAAVAVIALATAAISGLFSSPKGAVEKAMSKSFAAYEAAEQKLGIPDLSGLGLEQSYSQSFALKLNSINNALAGYDMSALSGLGLRAAADLSGKDRYMGFKLDAFWQDEDLLNLLVTVNDDEMYFNSPQITGESFYGLNTETLGADLAKTTGDDSVQNLSFNMFELIDMVMEKIDPKELERSIEAANTELWKAVEVKKTGARTLNINGNETKTAAYQVTIPQEAMEDYTDAIADIMSVMNYYDLYEEMFRISGVPREEVEDFLSQLEDMDVYAQLADIFKDGLRELGDLELELCISGGYVSAILYEDDIDGVDVELFVYLGGGTEYVDDFKLELKVNSTEITLESTGDHSLKSGVYTDETNIKLRQLSTNVLRISSELSYDPKGTGDNFTWEISIPGAGSLDMEGTLTTPGGNCVNLDLKDISLKVMGMEICSLGMEYYAGPFQGDVITGGKTELITTMDEEALMRMVLDTQERALRWSAQMEQLFADRLPPELFYSMLY